MADIVVAIPTFRRPLGLTRLLRALEDLDTAETLMVLIADNDADGRQGLEAAGALVRDGYRWPVEGIAVAARGISQTRNALVAQALARSDDDFFLAMIDDDEWPSRDWLESLLRVQRATGADIVQGPVLCVFEEAPSPWAVLSNRCAAPRQGSGPIARADAGGNVLMSSRCLVRAERLWFDPQFGLTGGEDKDFFLHMASLGARFAWAEDATAHTAIPRSRMSRSWALARAFRAGNCDLRITRKYDRSLTTLARESMKLAGALAVSPFEMLSPARRTQAAFTLARALGKAAAPLGGEYREYRRTHGA
jgi:glycosyltransferase involved in cell wall biosynthesis